MYADLKFCMLLNGCKNHFEAFLIGFYSTGRPKKFIPTLNDCNFDIYDGGCRICTVTEKN